MKPAKTSKNTTRALPLLSFADEPIPSAFEPGPAGAQAALAACAPALEKLSEIHLMCAKQEIEAFFAEHPGIKSFHTRSLIDYDSEGRQWTEENYVCYFSDGTDCESHDDVDLDEPDPYMRESDPFLGGSRKELLNKVKAFLRKLLDDHPLAAKALGRLVFSNDPSSLESIVPASAKARQEAFLIARESRDPGNARPGFGMRL